MRLSEPEAAAAAAAAGWSINWDRQKVPKLQLFLLFPLHRKSGGFGMSSTIFVCKTEKWIKTFVRGRVETENRLNTHISRIGS